MMDDMALEDAALDLFVSALRARHGYDFSGYAPASLKRRVQQLARDLQMPNIGSLIPRVLYEPQLMDDIVARLSVPVSDFFRDPEVFAALGREVLPVLASYPRLNIWHAGVAFGEEVYSMAIMLWEAGLMTRSQIYATDLNDRALEKAQEGIFSSDNLATYEDNYRAAGGTAQLADYYHARYDLIRMRRELLSSAVFAHHNLVTDGVFAETHLILCRNVMIYFSQPLKNRVLELFAGSLVRGGYLVLGNRENLHLSSAARYFETVSDNNRIYRLKRTRQ